MSDKGPDLGTIILNSGTLRSGADRIVAQANDVKWQVLRDLIEEYGREMYNLGAQQLLDRLTDEAARPDEVPACADCGEVHAPGVPPDYAALDQADGSPEACT